MDFNLGDGQIEKAVKSCYEQLLFTDFAYVFDNIREVHFARKRHTEMQPTKIERDVREVSDSGEVTIKKVVELQYPNSMDSYKRDYDNSLKGVLKPAPPQFPHWLALFYGGEKILELAGNEFVDEYERQLAPRKQIVLAAMQREEEELRKEQAAAQAAKEVDERRLARIAEIKSGKAKIVSFEDAAISISDASNKIPLIFDVAVQPLLNPDNSIRFIGENPFKISSNKEEAQIAMLQKLSGQGGKEDAILVVDFKESDGTLRCKVNDSNRGYVWLKLNKNSNLYGDKPLSIGQVQNLL